MGKQVYRLVVGILVVVLLVGIGVAADESLDCFSWELALTEPGLMTQVMPCRFSERVANFLAFAMGDRGFAASGFAGFEVVAHSDRPVLVNVKIVCKDPSVPPSMNEEQEKEVFLAIPLRIGTKPEAHLCPFATFLVPQEVLSEFPSVSSGLTPDRIVAIMFEPQTDDLELVIHSLSFYREGEDGEIAERVTVDRFSLHSRNGDGWWFGVFCSADGCDWTPLEESMTTTDSLMWVHHQGGTLDVVDDPSGDGRGLVMRVTIPPRVVDGVRLAESGPIFERWSDILVSRIYGFVIFPFREPPCETSIDVWASKEFVKTAVGSTSGTILLDAYDESTGIGWRSPFGPTVDSSLQAKLWLGSVIDGKTYLTLKAGPGVFTPAPVPGAPEFTPETWHTIRITIDAERMAYLYQDGVLVASRPLHNAFRGGTVGGHPGVYIHDAVWRGAYAVRGTVLYDNYIITCGDSVQLPSD